MEVKIIKKTKSLDNLFIKKLNVAAYARVSTKMEAQIFSLDSQIKYYTDIITRNNNWKFIKVYADNGISGRNLKNRNEFVEMINDSLNGKIDLIYTKSVSRFSRNTVDLLKVVRTLKEKGVTVIFEEENINTSTLEGELLLSVLAAVAQTESENISSHIMYGHEMARQNGKILYTSRPYGYNLKNEKLTINKKEAEVVKKIFELYINGHSIYKIAKYLNESKIKSFKKIKWSITTVGNILRNYVYIGTIERGKNTKNKNIYYIENHHEPIIDQNTWNLVQLKIKENHNFRKGEMKVENIYCGYCGGRCSLIQTKRIILCNSVHLYYKKSDGASPLLYLTFKKAFVELLFKILTMDYNKKTNNLELRKLRLARNNYYEKKDILVENYLNKKINDFLYNKECKRLDQIIKDFEEKIKKQESLILSESRVNQIRNDITNMIIDTLDDINEFNIELFNKMITFTMIGEIQKVRTKNPNNIKFFYDDKSNFLSDQSKPKSYLEYSERFIPIIEFKIRNLDKRIKDIRRSKMIKVMFYVRKEEV